MGAQLRVALVAVWLILSFVALAPLAAPFVLSEESLLAAGRRLQAAPHMEERCVLCGMTRAFAAVARGDFGRARTLNGWALPLYGTLVGNEMLAGTYLIVRARRLAAAKNNERVK